MVFVLFSIFAGVLQGDTPGSYLFAIVLDYVMRQAIGNQDMELGFELERRRSRRHPAVVITDLDFADAIALQSERIERAQEFLSRVENESAKVGLHLNAKKTKLCHTIRKHLLLSKPDGNLWKW